MKALFRTITIIAAAAAAISCGGNGAGKKAGTPAAGSGNAAPEIVPTVRVIEATRREVPQTETYSTTVQAFAVNNVVPQAGNRITKVNVEIGDFVRKGQVLAEMDKATLLQAKLKLANDSTELARLKTLYEQGGLSRSDYDAVVLAYNVSKTSYDNLVENTVLRSPINGVVTARNYDKGDMYTMTAPIYVVQQITPVKLLVGISETDYSKVSKGDKVDITVDALPGANFAGKVSRIYPVIDPASHTFTAEVVVPNEDKILRPGMFARVKVTFGIRRSVVLPDIAVVKLQGSGQRSVYLAQPDGTVKTSVVTLGSHIGNEYEILSGVEEGDLVVTKGQTALRDGIKVEILE